MTRRPPPSLVRYLVVGAVLGALVSLLISALGDDVPYVTGVTEALIFILIGGSAGVFLGALAYLIADRPRLGS